MTFFFNLWNREAKFCVMDNITEGNTAAWKADSELPDPSCSKGTKFSVPRQLLWIQVGEVMLLTVRISLWVDILILGEPVTAQSSF
jgi:hypothetical protein